ncbi:MAG TPA: FecR domain-containing protein [Rhizomicrobium sp.]|nr:FecR domain-containing protein [Rhizomicrobium sp.]
MHAEDIDEQASLWLAREQGGLTDAERAALDAWLARSSRHQIAYLRLQAAWERAGRLAALRSPMRSASSKSRALPWIRIPAIAAALLVLAFVGKTYLTERGPHIMARYSTAIGQTHSYQLADGTHMDLNTGTRLHTDIGGRERIVTLDAGEAFFEVAHDAAHPFVVRAANRRITDLGTKFSVFLNGDTVRVLVYEGRVRVETEPGAAGPAPVEADGGHVVIAQGMEALVFAKPQSEIVKDLGWRNGMLTFDQLPLADVAEAFNRYNAKHMLVEGNARKIRIGGSFKADNVEAFVQLLQQGFGLSVKNQGDKIVVSR